MHMKLIWTNCITPKITLLSSSLHPLRSRFFVCTSEHTHTHTQNHNKRLKIKFYLCCLRLQCIKWCTKSMLWTALWLESEREGNNKQEITTVFTVHYYYFFLLWHQPRRRHHPKIFSCFFVVVSSHL